MSRFLWMGLLVLVLSLAAIHLAPRLGLLPFRQVLIQHVHRRAVGVITAHLAQELLQLGAQLAKVRPIVTASRLVLGDSPQRRIKGKLGIYATRCMEII